MQLYYVHTELYDFSLKGSIGGLVFFIGFYILFLEF
jgi:hypothetical protein